MRGALVVLEERQHIHEEKAEDAEGDADRKRQDGRHNRPVRLRRRCVLDEARQPNGTARTDTVRPCSAPT